MTNPLPDGLAGYLILLVVGFLAHEPWRWLGFYLGRDIDADGEVFRWVKAIANALIAGLVLRLVVFSPGALADVAPWLRLSAFALGVAVFFLADKSLPLAMGIGMVALVGGQWSLSFWQ